MQNLEILIAEAGSAVKLARQANTSASYLSQIRRGLPTARGSTRRLGDKLAHKLERAMGKSYGWMDEPHTPLLPRRSNGRRYSLEDARTPGRLHPLLAWSAMHAPQHAGQPIRPQEAQQMLACPVPCSEDTFVLPVEGESMEPKFHPGELIYVDPQVPPRSGRYVVARIGGTEEAVLRQLLVEGGRRYFRALNPDWPQRIVEATAESVICGVVVFKGEPA